MNTSVWIDSYWTLCFLYYYYIIFFFQAISLKFKPKFYYITDQRRSRMQWERWTLIAHVLHTHTFFSCTHRDSDAVYRLSLQWSLVVTTTKTVVHCEGLCINVTTTLSVCLTACLSPNLPVCPAAKLLCFSVPVCLSVFPAVCLFLYPSIRP